MAFKRPMELGIFAKVFSRSSLADVLEAIRLHRFKHLQFNLSCVGLPTLPVAIDNTQCEGIRSELEKRNLVMSILSGTFNIIDPDRNRRAKGFSGLRVLASAANRLGTALISISTGTRNPNNMWAKHPENGNAETWREMLASIELVARIGDESGISFAFEPEQGNIVDCAAKARRLLDEVCSDHIKVLIDPANLLNPGNINNANCMLEEAFDLIGDDVVLAHAKEYQPGGELGGIAIGEGVIDFKHYVNLLKGIGYNAPLIIHGISEGQVDSSLDYLTRVLNDAP